MKNRHMEGEDHPLTLDEILDETNQLDISGATKQWLTLEALGKIQTLHLKSIKLIVCVAYRINTYVLYMTERTSNRFRIDKIVLLGVIGVYVDILMREILAWYLYMYLSNEHAVLSFLRKQP